MGRWGSGAVGRWGVVGGKRHLCWLNVHEEGVFTKLLIIEFGKGRHK